MLDVCRGGVDFGAGSVPECSEGGARAAGGLCVRLRVLESWLLFKLYASWSLTRSPYDDRCCSSAFTVVLLNAGCRSDLTLGHLSELGAFDALVRRLVGMTERFGEGASGLDSVWRPELFEAWCFLVMAKEIRDGASSSSAIAWHARVRRGVHP